MSIDDGFEVIDMPTYGGIYKVVQLGVEDGFCMAFGENDNFHHDILTGFLEGHGCRYAMKQNWCGKEVVDLKSGAENGWRVLGMGKALIKPSLIRFFGNSVDYCVAGVHLGIDEEHMGRFREYFASLGYNVKKKGF